MNATRSFREDLEYWTHWTVVNAVIWPLGFLGFIVAMSIGAAPDHSRAADFVIGSVVGGAIIALGQWLFLYPAAQRISLWNLFLTSIGWAAGLFVTGSVIIVSRSTPGWILGGALGGLVFGSFQSLGPQPQAKSHHQWILMSVVSWMMTFAIGAIFSNGTYLVTVEAIVQITAAGVVGCTLIGLMAITPFIVFFPHRARPDFDAYVRWWP